MAHARYRRLLVHRLTGTGARRIPDEIIVEEPLSIQLNGTLASTTMRTPGNDFELAVGYCYTEGLLAGQGVQSIQYCSPTARASETEFNVVNVTTVRPVPAPAARLSTTSSSCGWCGNDQIDQMLERLDRLPAAEPFPLATLLSVTHAVRERQRLFDRTGGVHSAAVFTRDGDVSDVREDVGRHNAVDKVIGAQVLAGGLPLFDRGLFVSGRASVELVYKAWSAGFSALLAISAPTQLAVEAARRSGLQLVGFVRDEEMNLYAPEKL